MTKDFWSESRIAVIGCGNFGGVLANLVAPRFAEVFAYLRNENEARALNSTRTHASAFEGQTFHQKIRAYSDFAPLFERPFEAIIWALPSSVTREVAKTIAPFLTGREILLHATKGVEKGTLKRMSEVLVEELPIRRIGAISGPNLANELAKGEPAATVVASRYNEVVEAGQEWLGRPDFRVYSSSDLIGVEWAGTLKNILAIASGALDAMGFGWNARAMLISRGLAEVVRFGVAMGGKTETFLGLAGVGDMMATCASPQSRNYRVGWNLAQGKKLGQILSELGSTAEGVYTTESVWRFAKERGIAMPITEGVYRVLTSEAKVDEVLRALMQRPQVHELG